MASSLLYLKSKKLLPKQEDETEELTEEELIRRIIEYKKYKEITKVFKENYLDFSKRIEKNQEEIKLPKRKLEINYTKALNILYNRRKAQSVKMLKNRNLRGLYCLSGVKVLYFNNKK